MSLPLDQSFLHQNVRGREPSIELVRESNKCELKLDVLESFRKFNQYELKFSFMRNCFESIVGPQVKYSHLR